MERQTYSSILLRMDLTQASPNQNLPAINLLMNSIINNFYFNDYSTMVSKQHNMYLSDQLVSPILLHSPLHNRVFFSLLGGESHQELRWIITNLYMTYGHRQ